MGEHRTINQLWDRFEAIKNRFGRDKDYSKLVNIGNWANPAQGRIEWVAEITSLRAELLEKCSQPITDGDGDDSTFDIYTEKAENPQTFIRSRHGIRFDTPETARNMSAAFAFWAWELEQRAIEAQKGGGE